MWISAAILVCLFMVQRFGTHKVGYSFAPIICTWFVLIGGIGFYNFFKFDPSVIKAVNPLYIFYYFKRNKRDAWISLGGAVLSITGNLMIIPLISRCGTPSHPVLNFVFFKVNSLMLWKQGLRLCLLT